MTAPEPHLSVDDWVLRTARPGSTHLRLLCVPHAGGGAVAYHQWLDAVAPGVEVWPLRLPGRESRHAEVPATDLLDLADRICSALAPELVEPFALFGHSLGAFLAFEVVRKLARDWGREASLLLVSARTAPQLDDHHGRLHELPDDEFLRILERRFGAIPPAMHHDAQLRAMYLPILRADARMLETYRFVAGSALRCPIVVYGGDDDATTGPEGLAAWGELTTGGSSVTMIGGGHFFLETHRRELLDHVNLELEAAVVP